jgi:putative ABC transport system permease protein
MRTNRYRIWIWLIRFMGVIVPRRFRDRFRQEWEAELEYREELLARWDRLGWRSKFGLLWRSLGAFWDALCLQRQRWEDEMIQDLRFGVRMLLKHKSFTTMAILSLTLGIGANTAIFQLLDAVRLRMLPVNAPHELAEIRLSDMRGAAGGISRSPSVNNPIWEQIRERQQAFSGVFAWGTNSANLATGGEVRPVRILHISGDFFNTLGLRAALGRLFTTLDDRRGCSPPGLVISHGFWQREYGGDANIIGRKLSLADHPFEIIGVTPAQFFGMEVGRSFDVALPICAAAIVNDHNMFDSGFVWWLTVTGRLKPGWSLEQATAQMQTISPGLMEAALPANYPLGRVKAYLESKLIAVPAGSGVSQLRETYEQPLWLLLALGGIVLLIACANLSNLLLARASVRERELAVRQALGASRWRLVRQLLVESLLLAAAGAAFGTGLALVLSRFLVAFLSTNADPVFLDLALDWRVLGFTTGLAVLTCFLFGLAPAVHATRMEPGTLMKAGGRGITDGRASFSLGFSWRRALTILQVALSLVLVAGALLFSRSLSKLLTVPMGFRPDGVLIAAVDFRKLALPPDRQYVFKDRLLDQMRAIPGVESASVTFDIPLSGWGSARIRMDGAYAQQRQATSLSRVGPDYFKTLQIPLLAGREFDVRDKAGAPMVTIVNEAFAREFSNGQSPVGRSFWTEASPGMPDTRYEIIGMVRDTKYGNLREEFRPIAYTAADQPNSIPGGHFLIRSPLPKAGIVAEVKRIINEIHPAITVSFQEFKPMIEATILRERLMATLSGFFGLLALFLACIGLYGVLSYGVASRTNEIGIRMALGAQARNVRWLILHEALLLLSAGVAVGLPLIVAVTRLAATLLFGLTPTDPVSLGLASLSLFAVGLLASYSPACRATKVDPLVALRHE